MSDHEHEIFGKPFTCADYQRITGMPCPDSEIGKRAHQAVARATDEIKIVDEATLGKNTVEAEPYDPYCQRFASEIPGLVEMATAEEMSPAEYARDDGTYNSENGHFACDSCYIKLGMPSSRYGWTAR
jgi:hypothetical protein